MLGVILIVNNALPLLYQCTDVINVRPENCSEKAPSCLLDCNGCNGEDVESVLLSI